MDYWGVVREAWSITRRSRPLWWLGTISAAQLIVYTFIVTMLALPMALIPQLLAGLPDASGRAASGDAAFETFRTAALTAVTHWISAYWPAILGGIIAVLAVWVVLGVFDVAAQPGLITQAVAVAERRTASVRAGLRDGFRLWWRTVGLLAIAVLPGLLYLLAMALVMFFTVSLPLSKGQAPNTTAAIGGQLLLSPVSTLVSLVSIPLSVLVQLALRSAVLDDVEWRPALGEGWRLLRARLSEVALMFLTFFAVVLVATLAFSLAFGVVLAILVAFVAVAASASGARVEVLWVAGGILGIVAVLAFLAFNAIYFAFQSVGWTLFWRRITGRAPAASYPPTNPSSYAPAYAHGGLANPPPPYPPPVNAPPANTATGPDPKGEPR